jgi:glycosyltransferase involved in cell wall biosynthesis
MWLHLANLRAVKDQETLIRGFADSLRKTKVSQKLFIVGSGELRESLEALVLSLEAEQDISFAGHQDEIPKWLAAADGFILSSKSEAMPMALLEAATAGLVLVSTRVGGVGEIIRDSENGFLFPDGDLKTLSEKIVEILSNKENALKLAKQCKREVIEQFSSESIVSKYLETYNRITRKG